MLSYLICYTSYHVSYKRNFYLEVERTKWRREIIILSIWLWVFFSISKKWEFVWHNGKVGKGQLWDGLKKRNVRWEERLARRMSMCKRCELKLERDRQERTEGLEILSPKGKLFGDLGMGEITSHFTIWMNENSPIYLGCCVED